MAQKSPKRPKIAKNNVSAEKLKRFQNSAKSGKVVVFCFQWNIYLGTIYYLFQSILKITHLIKRLYSYLQNRKQCVEVSEVLSQIKKVIIGVSQGSILGPDLFFIYVIDSMSSIKMKIQYSIQTTRLEVFVHKANLNWTLNYLKLQAIALNSTSTHISFLLIQTKYKFTLSNDQ